jgi:hypothetical protein
MSWEFFYSCVFNMFTMMFLKFATCSQNTSLYTISFAQSAPLLTNINEPKGRNILCSHINCSCGVPPNLRFLLLLWANQHDSLPKNKQKLGGNPFNEQREER